MCGDNLTKGNSKINTDFQHKLNYSNSTIDLNSNSTKAHRFEAEVAFSIVFVTPSSARSEPAQTNYDTNIEECERQINASGRSMRAADQCERQINASGRSIV
jgi:hypothetical protein